MRSLATVSAPRSSPSYSSSNLPVIEGMAAYTSATRGTTIVSPRLQARRSAFETTFSSTLIGSRCDTPERLSTLLSVRAWNASSSIDLAHVRRNAHVEARRRAAARLPAR